MSPTAISPTDLPPNSFRRRGRSSHPLDVISAAHDAGVRVDFPVPTEKTAGGVTYEDPDTFTVRFSRPVPGGHLETAVHFCSRPLSHNDRVGITLSIALRRLLRDPRFPTVP